MIFTKLELQGAYIIEPEKLEDERGFFARAWDSTIFNSHGLNPKLVQCNISFSKEKGTLRGMHYQTLPYEEAKLIRCTKGKIYDVIVDLRPTSTSYTKWLGVELSVDDYKMIYVPEGFAHGFQTLVNNTEVFYQISQVYNSLHEQGIRWDDPIFNIKWPIATKIISSKDLNWKLFHRS